jgi:hypothetical protein
MKKGLMSIGFAALFLTAGIAGAADVGGTDVNLSRAADSH